MEGKKTVYFNWDGGHFFNMPQQLASKLKEHTSTANFICHLIGGPLMGISGLALMNMIGGYYFAFSWSVFCSVMALSNDLPFGLIYTMFSLFSTYYQLDILGDISLLQIVLIFLFSSAVQIGLGHGVFEGELPTDEKGIVKFDKPVYNSLYFANGVMFGTFHFYSLVLLNLGIRPHLYKQVDFELSHINDLIAQARE